MPVTTSKLRPSAAVLAKLQGRVVESAVRIGHEAEAEATRRFSKPFPPASRPGQAPRLRSGELAGSVKSTVSVPRQNVVAVRLSASGPLLLREDRRKAATRVLRAALNGAIKKL